MDAIFGEVSTLGAKGGERNQPIGEKRDQHKRGNAKSCTDDRMSGFGMMHESSLVEEKIGVC